MRRGILATREELRSLHRLIGQQPYDVIYETLKRRCSLILETNPVTEAQWRSLGQQGATDPALVAARTTQGRILDLLVAHHIEKNDAYLSRAKEELHNLISWTAWVEPLHRKCIDVAANKSEDHADLCTAEAAVAAVVALDWLWEDISDDERTCVLQAIRTKALEPYRNTVAQQVSWYNTYSHANAVINSGCGLAALALGDDDPDAKKTYKLARAGLRRFFDALGREGGWDEGIGYWGFAMRYLLLVGEAARRLDDDMTILHERGMDTTGLFPIYFSPNGQAVCFGDNPNVPLYGTFYLLVKHFGMKDVTWWLDNYSFRRDVSSAGWSAAGLALLFRPDDAVCPDKPHLDTMKVYHEIGWAAMADQWPRPDMYVAAKTGDMAASHSQHDMNSIQMQVAGEMLLSNLGRPPRGELFETQPSAELYEVSARAHNTIVVAKRDHLLDAQGSIIESNSSSNHRYLAMDSAGACGDGVQFIRHVLMVVDPKSHVGEMVCVLDELESATPETLELLWHTRGQLERSEGRTGGVIRGKMAAVQFAIAATVRFELTDESHKLASRRTDTVLRATAGVVGKAYFASAFSRKKIAGELTVEQTADGVNIAFGKTSIVFARGKRHLVLDSVKRG